MMKKLLGAIALFLTCSASFAAGGTYPLEKAPNRINDMAALQNGAKLFVNYCLNCHSANSMRYNKLTEIGLTEEEIKKNLLFTSDKVGDLMHIAMTPQDAKAWFGTTPPDLSVVARSRSVNLGPSGVDYLYTYLRTFYRDTARGTGWNNLAFPDVGMPHVMWQRQGERTLTKTAVHQNADKQWERVTTVYDADGYTEVTREALTDYHGKASETFKFDAANPEAAAQFDSDMADLSNFLGWMAEPVQQLRKQIGVWVLLFLGLFLLVAWRLNAAYWKHVR